MDETNVTASAAVIPTRAAVMAYAEAWTYPVIGNADLPFVDRLFAEARALAEKATATPEDPPAFAGWLNTLLRIREGSYEWEDTLFEIVDYFGLSQDGP